MVHVGERIGGDTFVASSHRGINATLAELGRGCRVADVLVRTFRIHSVSRSLLPPSAPHADDQPLTVPP